MIDEQQSKETIISRSPVATVLWLAGAAGAIGFWFLQRASERGAGPFAHVFLGGC